MFRDLFDFSFSRFTTSKLVQSLYKLLLLIIAVGTCFAVASALTALGGSPLLGMLLLFATAVGSIIACIAARVSCELMIVLFRIAENTKTMANAARASSGNAAGADWQNA